MFETDGYMTEQKVNSEILGLFNERREVEYILERTAALLAGYLKCEAIGVRVMDKQGNIPYQTYVGFSDGFLKKENHLCIRHDRCACIEISKGEYDPSLPLYTPHGSFYTNELQALNIIRDGMKAGRFRGECVRVGWESLALVPIRFAHNYYGLIHAVDRPKDSFPRERVQFIENIASQLGLYIYSLESRKAAERELSSLLARVLHDIKNPLFSTKMFAEFIAEKYSDNLDPEVMDFLDRISRNTDYMGELVTGLSGFASECDLKEMEKDDLDLARAVRTVVSDIAAPEGSEVAVDLPGGSPRVRYAPFCLKRVLTNLVSNALKFSAHRDRPSVRVALEEKDLFYQISVSDNGMGIDGSEVEKVFAPFYRSDEVKAIPGNGLGLSICKKIVEKNGGRMWVYSDKGKGSTFYFTVPK